MSKNIGRRSMLRSTLAATAGLGIARYVDYLPFSALKRAHSKESEKPKLCFGILSDSHYADADARGSRHYNQSLEKMQECVKIMEDREDVEFLVQLGDFTDGASQTPFECLKKIETEFTRFDGANYHTLGNHCHDNFSKEQFLDHIENTGFDSARGYYSFDYSGIHCVVLDANYRGDGEPYDSGNFNWTDANIPEKQVKWLQGDLEDSMLPCIVYIHQCLDGKGNHYVENADEVRELLENSGKTLAVFQGHDHRGAYRYINDIHYYTLRAMVEGSGEENNAYAVVKIRPDGIVVEGYRRAVGREMEIKGIREPI